MSTLVTTAAAVAPEVPLIASPAANAGALPAGQKVFTFEHWTQLVGYQLANVAMTALLVCVGIFSGNLFLTVTSACNGLLQAGLILADWSQSDGAVSRASAMNATLTGISLGVLSKILRIGSMGLSIFGIGATAALYGIQFYHLTHK